MNKFLGISALLLSVGMSSAAHATITVLAPGTLSPAAAPVETFDSRALGQGAFVGADGGSYTGFGTVLNGSADGINAAPYFGFGPYSGVGAPPVSGSGQDLTNYLSMGPTSGANPGTPETISYTSIKNIFGLYWGSVDTYNTVDFFLGSNPTPVASFSGSDVTGLLATGCQTSFGCNGYVVFSDLSFDKVVLGSAAQFAFEVDNVFATAAPEISTWLMMLLGFGTLGWFSYKRAKSPAQALQAA